jgi:hypothetical protein
VPLFTAIPFLVLVTNYGEIFLHHGGGVNGVSQEASFLLLKLHADMTQKTLYGG